MTYKVLIVDDEPQVTATLVENIKGKLTKYLFQIDENYDFKFQPDKVTDENGLVICEKTIISWKTNSIDGKMLIYSVERSTAAREKSRKYQDFDLFILDVAKDGKTVIHDHITAITSVCELDASSVRILTGYKDNFTKELVERFLHSTQSSRKYEEMTVTAWLAELPIPESWKMTNVAGKKLKDFTYDKLKGRGLGLANELVKLAILRNSNRDD